jgi:hypothetical protein
MALHMLHVISLRCKHPVQVTVERRLYDIGSILSSANLIKKTYLGRKRCVRGHVCYVPEKLWAALQMVTQAAAC